MSLRKKGLAWGILFSGLIVALLFLYFYGFVFSVPEYSDQYFAPEYLSKYASPEQAFGHFTSAIISGDAASYQEVLGRTMTSKEQSGFKRYPGKKPEIKKIVKSRNQVFIVTDSDWGMFFEKVRGRWVFTPEDLGANVRSLFSLIN
jgi:hypothetical protein